MSGLGVTTIIRSTLLDKISIWEKFHKQIDAQQTLQHMRRADGQRERATGMIQEEVCRLSESL